MIHSMKRAATRSAYVDHAMDFFDSILSYLRLTFSPGGGRDSRPAGARRRIGEFPHTPRGRPFF